MSAIVLTVASTSMARARDRGYRDHGGDRINLKLNFRQHCRRRRHAAEIGAGDPDLLYPNERAHTTLEKIMEV